MRPQLYAIQATFCLRAISFSGVIRAALEWKRAPYLRQTLITHSLINGYR